MVLFFHFFLGKTSQRRPSRNKFCKRERKWSNEGCEKRKRKKEKRGRDLNWRNGENEMRERTRRIHFNGRLRCRLWGRERKKRTGAVQELEGEREQLAESFWEESAMQPGQSRQSPPTNQTLQRADNENLSSATYVHVLRREWQFGERRRSISWSASCIWKCST